RGGRAVAGAVRKWGPRGGGANEPGLRVDPLEGGGPDEADGLLSRRGVGRARCGDLPAEPQEEGGADPARRSQHAGMAEYDAAETEGDHEHHRAHAEADPEQAWQP